MTSPIDIPIPNPHNPRIVLKNPIDFRFRSEIKTKKTKTIYSFLRPSDLIGGAAAEIHDFEEEEDVFILTDVGRVSSRSGGGK